MTKPLHKGDDVKISINMQGGPVVNTASVWTVADDVAALSIDMKSKYCTIECVTETGGCPTLFIGGSKDSIFLKEGKEQQFTDVTFTEFNGWSVWCSDCARYTVCVCLVKK